MAPQPSQTPISPLLFELIDSLFLASPQPNLHPGKHLPTNYHMMMMMILIIIIK